MSGIDLPLFALRAQLASAVDLVVQTARLRDGRRMVTHVTEVCGADPQHGYRLKDIFASVPGEPSSDGKTVFQLEPTGVLPDCLPMIQSFGCDLPLGVYETARRARGGS
jgi:pilus assembly protein CpaF